MLRAKQGVAKYVVCKFFSLRVQHYSTRAVASMFCEDCTTLEEALYVSFEVLSMRLREDSVIDACGRMLLRVIQLANWRRHDHPLISGTVNVKIFLAAYMIAAHPSHVFEKPDGDLEQKVLSAAKPMLQCYHDTAAQLAKGVSWPAVRKGVAVQLPALLCQYLRAFKVNYPYQIFCTFATSLNLTAFSPMHRIGSWLTSKCWV
jgi:hypothetical protein